MRPREMRLVCQHTSGNLRGFVVKAGSIHTGERPQWTPNWAVA